MSDRQVGKGLENGKPLLPSANDPENTPHGDHSAFHADSRGPGPGGALTQGSLLAALVYLAWPMLVTALLQNAQNLIDLYWVGGLGKEAVASVTMGGTVLMVMFPMIIGIAAGTIALVARAVGGGDFEEASTAAAQSLILAAVLGGASACAGWFVSGPAIRLLGASPLVIEQGGAYLRISLIGSFTVFLLFIGNSAMRGAGDARTPMVVMGLANVLNILLDPICIFGVGPVPALGVRGAAVATVLSQAAAAAITVRALVGGISHIRIHAHQLRPDLRMSWRILRVGMPGSAQMMSRSLMALVMMRIVASCGTAAVAAYGLGLRIHMMCLMPAFALGGATATLVGQNLGALKPERARRSAWLAAGLDAAFMAFAALVLAVFAGDIVAFFNDNPEVVRVGSRYLRVVSPFYVFAALGIVLSRGLQGAGDTLAPMIITIVVLWGVQVPLAILFSHLWQPATAGIWYAISAAMVIQGTIVVIWFERGKWKEKKV